MSRLSRRGRSTSPWFGAAPRRAQTDRTSRDLLPASSWWVDAPDFYAEAKRQAPRMLEGGGPLVRRGSGATAALEPAEQPETAA